MDGEGTNIHGILVHYTKEPNSMSGSLTTKVILLTNYKPSFILPNVYKQKMGPKQKSRTLNEDEFLELAEKNNVSFDMKEVLISPYSVFKLTYFDKNDSPLVKGAVYMATGVHQIATFDSVKKTVFVGINASYIDYYGQPSPTDLVNFTTSMKYAQALLDYTFDMTQKREEYAQKCREIDSRPKTPGKEDKAETSKKYIHGSGMWFSAFAAQERDSNTGSYQLDQSMEEDSVDRQYEDSIKTSEAGAEGSNKAREPNESSAVLVVPNNSPHPQAHPSNAGSEGTPNGTRTQNKETKTDTTNGYRYGKNTKEEQEEEEEKEEEEEEEGYEGYTEKNHRYVEPPSATIFTEEEDTVYVGTSKESEKKTKDPKVRIKGSFFHRNNNAFSGNNTTTYSTDGSNDSTGHSSAQDFEHSHEMSNSVLHGPANTNTDNNATYYTTSIPDRQHISQKDRTPDIVTQNSNHKAAYGKGEGEREGEEEEQKRGRERDEERENEELDMLVVSVSGTKYAVEEALHQKDVELWSSVIEYVRRAGQTRPLIVAFCEENLHRTLLVKSNDKHNISPDELTVMTAADPDAEYNMIQADVTLMYVDLNYICENFGIPLRKDQAQFIASQRREIVSLPSSDTAHCLVLSSKSDLGKFDKFFLLLPHRPNTLPERDTGERTSTRKTDEKGVKKDASLEDEVRQIVSRCSDINKVYAMKVLIKYLSVVYQFKNDTTDDSLPTAMKSVGPEIRDSLQVVAKKIKTSCKNIYVVGVSDKMWSNYGTSNRTESQTVCSVYFGSTNEDHCY